METRPKPIAYRAGRAGGVYHPDCYWEYSNEYFIANGARVTIGTIYLPGNPVEREKCARCSQPIKPNTL